MRKEMKKYLTTILLLSATIISVQAYTLEQLIEAGLDNSYSVRQKEILHKNARHSITSASWNLLPSADVEFNRTNLDGSYSSKGSLTFARSLTLNEPTVFNYQQARLDKSIAQLDLLQAKKEIIYNIYSAWLDIAQIQKEITIRQENLLILQKLKEQTVLQLRLGQRTSFDVNQSDINVINAELAIAELQNRKTGLRAELLNQVKLKDDGSEIVYNADVLPALDTKLTSDEDEPLLILKLKQDLRKSRLDKTQQMIGLFPALNLFGRYERYSVDNNVLSFADYEESYTLGLGLSWSLWTPWTKGSSYAQTSNNLLLKQWQYEDSQSQLKLDKQNLSREWTYLSETLALNKKKALQANDNLRIAQEKYNLGSLSLIELEQARVDALDAELTANKISYQLHKKLQEWNLLNSLPILNKY